MLYLCSFCVPVSRAVASSHLTILDYERFPGNTLVSDGGSNLCARVGPHGLSGESLLGHVLILCFTFQGTTKLFYRAVAPFDVPIGYKHQHSISPFGGTVVLVGGKWYLVVSIYIFLVTNGAEHLVVYLSVFAQFFSLGGLCW